MAKNISLAGAVFPDVPSILLPQQGGGMVSYVDVTGTTAVASDVAQGKKFYAADGTETTGTASGGGGGTPILGALRPDAELVKRWSYNKLMVQDEGKTLPSYTTTQTSLVGSSLIETVSIDETSYCYMLLQRTLSYPVYSSSVTKGKGRAVFHTYIGAYEMVTNPPITMHVDGATSVAPAYSVSSITRGHNPYFSSASAITIGQNNSGVYMTLRSPSYQSGSISVYSPYVYIKGNTTYFTQTYWNFMVDAKAEYIIELYRAPKTPINGWALTSQFSHVFDCFSNGGTLT